MQIEYKGSTISVEQDTDPESPRSWCDLGTMVCFHGRYDLGDEHEFKNPNDLSTFIHKSKVIALPLFLYDHLGITISTTPFSCSWDSGQIGFIYVTKEQIRKEFKRITKKVLEKVNEILKAEVKTYDQYLRGEVYYYTIKNDKDEIVASDGGYYGEDYCLEEAKSTVEWRLR